MRVAGEETTGVFQLRQEGIIHSNVRLCIPSKCLGNFGLRQRLENYPKRHVGCD